jgi:predicted neutral ceramidase superfamily lipid hydrolase
MIKTLLKYVLAFMLIVIPADIVSLAVVVPWFINTNSWFIFYLGYLLIALVVVFHLWYISKVFSIYVNKDQK